MKRLRLVSMLGGPTPAVGSPATPAMLNGSRSMRRNLGLLLLVLALPASAADRAEEVRATEIAFAKAFADRDAKKFSCTSPTTLSFSDGATLCTGSKK